MTEVSSREAPLAARPSITCANESPPTDSAPTRINSRRLTGPLQRVVSISPLKTYQSDALAMVLIQQDAVKGELHCHPVQLEYFSTN